VTITTLTLATTTAVPNKDRHVFYNFDLSSQIPGTGPAVIDGIEVGLDIWVDSNYGDSYACVELSWDGGNSWTSYDSNSVATDDGAPFEEFGGSTNTWGRTWTINDLTNGNFRVRVTNVSTSNYRDFFLAQTRVKVYYHLPGEGGPEEPPDFSSHQGPCDYAVDIADWAKSQGIVVYVIAFGATDTCDDEYYGSPWSGVSSVDFLEALATDEDHFFNEPKSSDLTPVFQAIGGSLTAGGSKLVE